MFTFSWELAHVSFESYQFCPWALFLFVHKIWIDSYDPSALVFSLFDSYQCSFNWINLHMRFNDSIQILAYVVLNRFNHSSGKPLNWFICSLNRMNLRSFRSLCFWVVVFCAKFAAIAHIYIYLHTHAHTHFLIIETFCKYALKSSNNRSLHLLQIKQFF